MLGSVICEVLPITGWIHLRTCIQWGLENRKSGVGRIDLQVGVLTSACGKCELKYCGSRPNIRRPFSGNLEPEGLVIVAAEKVALGSIAFLALDGITASFAGYITMNGSGGVSELPDITSRELTIIHWGNECRQVLHGRVNLQVGILRGV